LTPIYFKDPAVEGGEFAGQPEAAGPVLVAVALAEVVGPVVDLEIVVDAELADEIVVAVVAVPGIH
jgi:hypothetical protein